MYQLTDDFSLLERNTFGIPVTARHFLTTDSPADFIRYFNKNPLSLQKKRLFLGAGSNLLFVNNFEGLVIHSQIGGIQIINDNKNDVEIEVGSGVNWDHFVAICVENGWWGVENLSLIPGQTGAVPVQNIGAYGVEASSVIKEVRGIELGTLENIHFKSEDCKFGYRTSLFKEELKEQFWVTSVVFRLSRKPLVKIQYEGLEAKIRKMGEINLQNIRAAIIEIRQSKLPDPNVTGNAGSFFKNPVVTDERAMELKISHPDIPLYPVGAGFVKIAAGWLIDKAGWKGKSVGRAAVHSKQALVIINEGGATGYEIFNLSKMVAADVQHKFNIELEPEVQII